MKPIIISMAVAAGLFIAANVFATDMPPLAKELNCTACHTIDHKMVGPAWHDVSAKYKGASTFNYNGTDYPLVDGLVMKVSRGGSGNWGMAMPPNDPRGAKKDKIEQLVHFVLALENPLAAPVNANSYSSAPASQNTGSATVGTYSATNNGAVASVPNGLQTYSDGGRYEGQLVNNMRHGKGIYTYPDGSRYDGEWVNGDRTGKGSLTWGSQTKWAGDRYEGDFVSNQRTGQGIYTWANGNRFEGVSKDGNFIEGTERNSDGIVVATWINGVKTLVSQRQQVAVQSSQNNYQAASDEAAEERMQERYNSCTSGCSDRYNSCMNDAAISSGVGMLVGLLGKDQESVNGASNGGQRGLAECESQADQCKISCQERFTNDQQAIEEARNDAARHRAQNEAFIGSQLQYQNTMAQTNQMLQQNVANARAREQRQQEQQRQQQAEQQRQQQAYQQQQQAQQEERRRQQLAYQEEQRRKQEEQERNTCHSVNNWVAVNSILQTDYTYCKVNAHTGAGLTAGIKNNGSKVVNVNVCAYNASGVKIKCVDYDLSPGQSLGGWATELVWCGPGPRSVRYSARLASDPETCNRM